MTRYFSLVLNMRNLSQVQVLEPALKGTLNVLKACSKAKVKRVVYVSSASAVLMNPSWLKEQVMDETCWSDKEYCKDTGVKNSNEILIP